MKGLTGRLGVWFMRVLALLPLPVLRGMGWLLGQVAFVLVAPAAGWRCAIWRCVFLTGP